MKRISAVIGLLLMIATLMPTTNASPKKEHRSVWCSAFVGDWPSSAITASNASVHKLICDKMVDSLAANNFTTIYYHARMMCDAAYDSKYEPWSSYIVGTRGETPAFDPLGYLLEQAHKKGIEVYAWVNPYRYASGTNQWGQSDRDYVKTHPEWLLQNSSETILNPGLPEVEQRIVDVCEDMISKYDVDGLVFDDYFYNSGGIGMDADADLYQKYTSGGGTLSQADWRRENVNTMVRKVDAMIKKVKPWVRFGISPAGIAGTAATSASIYGVKPSPGSDWQYNQIYSDPLAWLNEGTIDFISPQVYWPINGTNDFAAVSEWWSYIAKHFNRQVYISQSLSDYSKYDFSEYMNQINITRNVSEDNAPGMVYFKWSNLITAAKTVDRKPVRLMTYLKTNNYSAKSFTPSMPWQKGDQAALVSNIQNSNGVLTWTGKDNVRYVIYAVPESVADNDFKAQQEYIVGISYTTDFTLPDNYKSGYKYAISILDRYGNEFSPLFLGAAASNAPAVTLNNPENNAVVSDFAKLSWDSNASKFVVEVAKDDTFNDIIYSDQTEDKYLYLTHVFGLRDSEKYSWRVTSQATNCNDTKSEARSFTYNKMVITSPANNATGVALNPTISWTKSGDNVSYTLLLSSSKSMTDTTYCVTTNNTETTIPDYVLYGGSIYYAQLRGNLDGKDCLSDIVTFTTQDITPNIPVFTFKDGEELFSNSILYLKPEKGIIRTRVEISATDAFPPRSSYITNLENHSFVTPALGAVKLSGASLVKGKTYYVRARFEYASSTSTTNLTTDYCATMSFVYNDGSGVSTIGNDKDIYVVNGVQPILVVENGTPDMLIELLDASGKIIDPTIGSLIVEGKNSISLGDLAKGVYLISIKTAQGNKIVKFVH